MKHWGLAGLACLILLCCGSYVMGQGDDQYTRGSLRNLDSLVVAVSIDDNLAPYIHKERLITIIELELRKAGIIVVGETSHPQAGLVLKVVALPYELSEEVVGYSVAVNLDVEQMVWLERDPGIRCLGSTWSEQYVARWGISKASEASEELVRAMVESFHNAYLAANGKP